MTLIIGLICIGSINASCQIIRADTIQRPVNNLTPVNVRASAKSHSAKLLTAESIKRAKAYNALDVIMKLNPSVFFAENGACSTNDSLSLHIDGVRRSSLLASELSSPASRDSLPQDMGRDDVWKRLGTAIDNGTTGSRQKNLGNTLIDRIKTELASIPSADIKLIRFVSCEEWSREIKKRNVIWVELK